MKLPTIFKQTIAVNSLYPLRSQWELFLRFINKHGLLFLVICLILLIFLVLTLVLTCKNSFTVESGLLRNFLIEGV